MKKFSLIALSLVLVLGGSAPALASRGAVHAGSAGTNVSVIAPLPMQFFCRSNASECRADRRASVAYSEQLLVKLQQVNRSINRAIRPQANTSGGWKINPAAGDCNDYALSKRSALVRQGVPAGALRLAVTKTRRGEPHLVLIVKTDVGDLVLDNLNDNVRTLRDTGYSISSMSSNDPRRWVRG